MATDLSQYGGEGYVPTPGFDPLGRGGDRYGVISGPPLPFENEPAPISQTPNLGVLPELLGIYNPPPAQPISDLERIAYAPPAPVRFTAQQPTVFGPVTASGYAQPPVNPLSYYQPVAQPVPQAPANPNASTRWTDYSSIKPSTYDASQMEDTSVTIEPGTGEGYVPTPGYDPLERGGDRYGIVSGPGSTPGTGPGKVDEIQTGPGKVEDLTPEQVTQITEGQTPTTTPEGTVVTPGKENPVYPTETFDITTSPVAPVTFTEPAPTVPIQRIPTTTAPTRRPYRIIPALEPITVPMPPRREIEPFRTGYFRDINYDPELILAAAMRSLGPRYAKQSVIDEQRMFERMMR